MSRVYILTIDWALDVVRKREWEREREVQRLLVLFDEK